MMKMIYVLAALALLVPDVTMAANPCPGTHCTKTQGPPSNPRLKCPKGEKWNNDALACLPR